MTGPHFSRGWSPTELIYELLCQQPVERKIRRGHFLQGYELIGGHLPLAVLHRLLWG